MQIDKRQLQETAIDREPHELETVMEDTDLSPQPSLPGIHPQQLKTNYEAIIRDRAIYYPVAYQLERVLGQGRQGMVFLGLRQGSRGCITRHAIKIFDPGIYSNTKKYWTDMGRIATQISRLQGVNSPNLVSRDAYEETNGIGYVQMENVDGIDLNHLLSGEHIAVAQRHASSREFSRYMDVIFRKCDDKNICLQPAIAIYILRGMLRGLETLHDSGYVHSDIKPANIMVNRLGNVKLVDYGRAVHVGEKMTILLGTPMYMAPEIHQRKPSLVQSDLFSVGLVGIEMLSGKTIVPTGTMTEKELYATKMELAKNLENFLPEHVMENKLLVELLRRFIEPKPEDRYRYASEAEAGDYSLRLIHKQLAQLGQDAEYGRELKGYLDKILPPKKIWI